MAISRQTLRLARDLRIVITGLADDATRKLVRAWGRAWDEVSAEFDAAIADLIAAGGGEWPTMSQVMRASRARKAMSIALRELRQLADMTGVLVVESGSKAVVEAARAQAGLIASQMPKSAGTFAELRVRFDRVDQDVLGAIVERTTEQVNSLTRPLSDEATEAMLRALIRGVVVGENPRLAARQMLRRLEGAFNGGLTRALVIARTEILDAHRSGAGAGQFMNMDVLQGWTWNAQLDKRTCPSCWAQHGSMHPLSDPGPMDHQSGRCSRTPVTKSWRSLGFAVPEPPSAMRDAQAVFRSLSKAEQLGVMGPVRLQALDRGAIDWRDLSARRVNPGWRDSFVPASINTLRRKMVRSVA